MCYVREGSCVYALVIGGLFLKERVDWFLPWLSKRFLKKSLIDRLTTKFFKKENKILYTVPSFCFLSNNCQSILDYTMYYWRLSFFFPQDCSNLFVKKRKKQKKK